MRLKKLVLHGFKSFADRTEFKFDQPITCVVGPNGCGKSNVVDAIKWVLGEQSAKSLRGGAMLDVIFNGADARKPAGMAEVELVFDNPPKPDGARYLTVETDEVSVTRRLWRDGTSEYLINNQSGRLKDIKELFLDTGVGVDAYSIIEQGRVARLLEANPVERRQIFEEAAGISRFKVRKKEAERKLEKVDTNLARLSDINGDLERRLRGVRIQAGRARTYQELAGRLGELRLQHALHEYHTLFNRLTTLRTKEEDARFRLDDTESNLNRVAGELSEKRQQSDDAAQARQRVAHELVELRGKIQQSIQQADYARRQQSQIDEQESQFVADRESVVGRLAEVASIVAEMTASVAALAGQLAAGRSDIESAQAQHRESQLRANEISRAVDQHKASMLDAMRKLAQVESRLNSIEIERRNAGQQQERLAGRKQVLADESTQVDARRAELSQAIESTLAQIADLNAQSDARTNEASSLSTSIKQLTDRLGSAREHRSGLMSRQKTLSEMEARREGVSDSVQWVLRNREHRFPFIRGLVADVLRVDVEHAQVIEAALDGRDQWLVADAAVAIDEHRQAFEDLTGRVNVLRVDPYEPSPVLERVEPAIEEASPAPIEIDTAVSIAADDITFIAHSADPVVDEPIMVSVDGKLIDSLASSGRVEGSQPVSAGDSMPIIPDAQVDPAAVVNPDDYDWRQHEHRVRLAIDLVRFEPADRAIAEHLLARTAVVESLADALDLHQQGPHGWRFVTRQGDVVEADGTFRTGPLGASMSILTRRSELDALGHQINDVDVRIKSLQQELAEGNDQARQIDQAIAALRQQVYQHNTTRVELNGQQQQNESRLNAIARELPLVDRELEQLNATLARLDDESTTLAGQRSTLTVAQSDAQQQVQSLEAEQRELADTIQKTAETLTAARVALGQLEEKQFAATQSLSRGQSQEREFSQQMERLVKSIESLAGRREQVSHDLAQAEHARGTLDQRVVELQTQTDQLDARLAELVVQVNQLSASLDELRAARSQVEQEVHKLQIDVSETNVRLETLVQRTSEEIQIDLASRYAEVNAEPQSDVDPTEAEPHAVAIDWAAIADEIRQLKDRIQKLGNVNLDSLTELEELERQFTDNTRQLEDLTSSKLQLEQLIDQINKESGVRFAETFEAVREQFQQMFRKLFGGGKADIVLETELEDKKAVQPEGADPLAGPVMRRVDPLDAGIEVIARPPGKNPVTLSQLSGGEKAMTCIALLMSIFKAKPSPFCILDEVDAPLDEANNVRFGEIVQEFLSTSQFIIITHHKRTMQIADSLYGITQQTQGVSTRVPVRFDQVDAGGRIKAEAIVAA
jgi:chromosome segregation protein